MLTVFSCLCLRGNSDKIRLNFCEGKFKIGATEKYNLELLRLSI